MIVEISPEGVSASIGQAKCDNLSIETADYGFTFIGEISDPIDSNDPVDKVYLILLFVTQSMEFPNLILT